MLKKKGVKKIFLTVTITAALLFAAYCIMWIVYKQTYFDKVIKNNPDLKMDADGIAYHLHIYSASDSEVPAYTLAIFLPDSIGSGFSGNYHIGQPLVLDEQGKPEEEYNIRLSIKPHLFKEMDFSFSIIDYSNAASCDDHDNIRSYYFTTNTDMEFAYGDSEAYKEMLDTAGDEIRQIVAAAKENFCID